MLKICTYGILIILVSCSRPNLLIYKYKRNYSENSVISKDSAFKLYQTVCYNKRGVVDEEFCYDLTLKFIDTTAAKAKRTLDLQSDTLIVKAEYGLFSVWNWGNENNNVSGRIELLKWTKNEITLKENIQAIDLRREEIKRFVGTRTFNRAKDQ